MAGSGNRKLRSFTAAHTAYKRINASLATPDREVWRGIAACLRSLGRRADAEERLRRIAGRWPRDPWPWVQLGLMRVDVKDHTGAAEAFGEAVQRVPGDARLRLNHGAALVAAGRVREGGDQLLAALNAAPRAPRIRRTIRALAVQLTRASDKTASVVGRELTTRLASLPPLGEKR